MYRTIPAAENMCANVNHFSTVVQILMPMCQVAAKNKLIGIGSIMGKTFGDLVRFNKVANLK